MLKKIFIRVMPRVIHVTSESEWNKHLNAKGFGGSVQSVRIGLQLLM
jgi:hypothetical protein